jgi:hypothetical protein
VIGQLQETLPGYPKNTKLPLNDIRNIINFRLSSPSNIEYKWSVYSHKDNG